MSTVGTNYFTSISAVTQIALTDANGLAMLALANTTGETQAAEPTIEPVAEPSLEKDQEPNTEAEVIPVEPAKELSFDEMFKTAALKVIPPGEDEEEEGESEDKDKKKKKKKSKSRVITYDPDLDITIVHKKHKTDNEEWEA